MRISDFLWRSEERYGTQAAIVDARRSVTFAEFATEVRRVSAWFTALGLQPGERIAVVSKNSIEYSAVYFAASDMGAVIVPLNWRLRVNELTTILQDSHAVAVFAGPEFTGSLTEARSQHPTVRHWVALNHSATGWDDWAPPSVSKAVSLATGNDAETVVVQMYTSGTTGAARGAMLTNRNLRSMVLSWLLEVPMRAEVHRFLQVTPLFHVGGLLMLLANVTAGVELELHDEFFPGPALEALVNKKITHALLVPAMLQWVLAEPGARDAEFPLLELVIYGAAPMPVPLLEDALQTFGCSFLQGYGLTETSGVLTVLRPEDHRWPDGETPPARLASAGRCISCCDVRVIHPDGRTVDPGEIGEIVARGDNIMAGYYGLPEATAATFRDGWLRTGDLATIDDAGFIYIVDRQKDMIIVGGENVYPQEIEAVLRRHPAVTDAAVIGIPHVTWGEEVLAFVVRSAHSAATDRDLIQHCRQALARFKCPTKIEFRDVLPRNAAGKLLKRELRAPYWINQTRQV